LVGKRTNCHSTLPTVPALGRNNQCVCAFFYDVQLPMEFQHVASKNLCAFICGGTRTQFRCVGAGGWRRRRWCRRGRRRRRWQWSRWSERSIRDHRQLKRPGQRSERQQRYSTLWRPKRSEWQWRCSTPRQHRPKQYQFPRDRSWTGEHRYRHERNERLPRTAIGSVRDHFTKDHAMECRPR
jgi:hypothetical protein